MASELLRFIASHDDVIKLCGPDESLADRLRSSFSEASSRPVTFDPIMCAASNPELLSNSMKSGSRVDIWTNPKKENASKRGFDRFDQTKFTNNFIKLMTKHFESPEVNEAPPRSGFDAYAYLMEYEDEIMALYGNRELSKLQMAALHYIEINKPEVELDYFKYIATYDDLVQGTVAGNPGKGWAEWIPEVGKMHYDSSGKIEIAAGTRPVVEFFNATKYMATYPQVQDNFKNKDGSVNEQDVAAAYITLGAQSGLVRDGFAPTVFLANYPEHIESDIYVNGNPKDGVSAVKVAMLWLQTVKEGAVDLTRFDAVDFKETAGLADDVCAFKSFVELKTKSYMKTLKKQAKFSFRLGKMLCGSKKLANRKNAPKEAPEPVAESEPVVLNVE